MMYINGQAVCPKCECVCDEDNHLMDYGLYCEKCNNKEWSNKILRAQKVLEDRGRNIKPFRFE